MDVVIWLLEVSYRQNSVGLTSRASFDSVPNTHGSFVVVVIFADYSHRLVTFPSDSVLQVVS